MDTHLIRSLRSRGLALVATTALALSGLILLAADLIAENQAMMLGGLTLLFFTVAVFFLGPLRMPADRHDFWESVAWGKLFVAMVYASIAIMFLLAFVHSPGVTHAIRASFRLL